MNLSKLAFVVFSGCLCTLAHGGGPPLPCPEGATVVGTIAARLGTYVVVALGKGAHVQPNEELTVGRPALLVAVAKGKERVEAWGEWEGAGHIKVRFLRGESCAIAFVTRETPRSGLEGELAANIRPGDVVCVTQGTRPPSPKPPAAKAGPSGEERKQDGGVRQESADR